jgi:hypothetical protein
MKEKSKLNFVHIIKLICTIIFAIVIIKFFLVIWNALNNPGKAASGAIDWVEKELSDQLSACKPSCKNASGEDACNGFPPILNPKCLLGLAAFDWLLGFFGIGLIRISRIIPFFKNLFAKWGWTNDTMEFLKAKFSLTNEQITSEISDATKKITNIQISEIEKAKQDILKNLEADIIIETDSVKKDLLEKEYNRINNQTPEEFKQEAAERAGINKLYNIAKNKIGQDPTQLARIELNANTSLSRVTGIEVATNPEVIKAQEEVREYLEEQFRENESFGDKFEIRE